MLHDFTVWLEDFCKMLFTSLVDCLTDIFIAFLHLFISSVVGLIGLIPLPDVLQHGMSTLFGSLDPGIVYILNQTGVFVGLSFIGGAYAFKLVRKVVTVFQW